MGAFILSNLAVSSDVLYSRGHKHINSIELCNAQHLFIAEKINIRNENYIDFGNGEYIVGVGTYVYKGKTNRNALGDLYSDFKLDREIDDIWGHYAMVIKRGDDIYIWGDRGGIYRIYYYQQNNGYCVTSSYLSLVSAIENPCFDKIGLAAYLDGIECPFVEGCNVLDGEHILHIDKDGVLSLIRKATLTLPISVSSFSASVQYVKDLLRQQIVNVQIIADELRCGVSSELTGGLDSRLIACLLKHSALEFDFVNYPIYGKDRDCAQQVASQLNKELKTIDYIPIEDKEISTKYGEFDFGFNYYRHYPRSVWNFPHPIQLNGFRGEGISTYPFMDNNRNFKIGPHITKRLSPLVKKQYRYGFRERMAEYYKHIGINIDKSLNSFEQNLYALDIFGSAMDGNFISGQNAFNYFISIFAEYKFYFALSAVENDIKRERRLELQLIKEIDDTLASIQFCSHMRNEGLSIKDVDYIKDRVYTGFKPYIPDWLLNKLYLHFKPVQNVYDIKELLEKFNYKEYGDIIRIKKVTRYPILYTKNLQRLCSVEFIRQKFNISFGQ